VTISGLWEANACMLAVWCTGADVTWCY